MQVQAAGRLLDKRTARCELNGNQHLLLTASSAPLNAQACAQLQAAIVGLAQREAERPQQHSPVHGVWARA